MNYSVHSLNDKNQSKKLKALIYNRQLTNEFTGHAIKSYGNGESAIKNLCKERNYDDSQTHYIPDGLVDKSHAHNALELLKNEIDSFHVLIVPDLSSILGTINDLYNLFHFLSKNNIYFISIREKIDTSIKKEYDLVSLSKIFSKIEEYNLTKQMELIDYFR